MKRNTRFISAALAMLMILSVFILHSPLQSYASSGTRSYSQQVAFTGTRNAESQYARFYTQYPTKILKNKTPSVAKVKVLNKSTKGHPMYIIAFNFKKNKPAKIYVEQSVNGTKTKYDLVMNPTSYTSPAKSVKIDGKSYFTGNTWIQESNKTLKGKIKVTTKKNWKINSIYKFNTNQWNNNPKLVQFKNGGNISVKKNERLVIKYQNTKTNQMFHMFYNCGFNHTK